MMNRRVKQTAGYDAYSSIWPIVKQIVLLPSMHCHFFREFQSTKELHDSAVILLKANFIKATQISKPRYKKFLCLKINTA